MSQNFLRSVFLFSKKVMIISLKTTFNVALEARRELLKQVREYNLKEKREMEFETYRKIAEATAKSKILDSNKNILDQKQPSSGNAENIQQTQTLLDKILKESTTPPLELEKKKTDEFLGKVNLKPQKILERKTNVNTEDKTTVISSILDAILDKPKSKLSEKTLTAEKSPVEISKEQPKKSSKIGFSIQNNIKKDTLNELKRSENNETKIVKTKSEPDFKKRKNVSTKEDNIKLDYDQIIKNIDKEQNIPRISLMENHIKSSPTIEKNIESCNNDYTNLYDEVVKKILVKSESETQIKTKSIAPNQNTYDEIVNNILTKEENAKMCYDQVIENILHKEPNTYNSLLQEDNIIKNNYMKSKLKLEDISLTPTSNQNIYDKTIDNIMAKEEDYDQIIENILDKKHNLKFKDNPEDMKIKVRKIECRCNEFPHLHFEEEERIGRVTLTVLDKKYEPGTIQSNAYSYDNIIDNIMTKEEIVHIKPKDECELFSHLPSDEFIGKVVIKLKKVDVPNKITIDEPEYTECQGKSLTAEAEEIGRKEEKTHLQIKHNIEKVVLKMPTKEKLTDAFCEDTVSVPSEKASKEKEYKNETMKASSNQEKPIEKVAEKSETQK